MPGRPGAAAFNRADVEAPTAFDHRQAVNHQAGEEPLAGAAAIREVFARGFAAADMICIVEDGGSSNGAHPRGCGFFHVDRRGAFRRGCPERLTFLRLQCLLFQPYQKHNSGGKVVLQQ